MSYTAVRSLYISFPLSWAEFPKATIIINQPYTALQRAGEPFFPNKAPLKLPLPTHPTPTPGEGGQESLIVSHTIYIEEAGRHASEGERKPEIDS